MPKALPMFQEKLRSFIDTEKVTQNSRILFVDDGSTDMTWELICRYSKKNEHVCGIGLSRNRGHQNALIAGMMEAKQYADIVITIDCDGQDDVAAMDDMLKAHASGSEVVYGIRDNRDTDTFFKRFTAESFYRIMNSMGAEVVFNHADYRLVSKSVLDALSEYKEVNLFLRGMFPLVGFEHSEVYYKRNERIAGESHDPLRKMLALAVDGITSLSTRPIRMITGIGMLESLLSFLGILWVFISFFMGQTIPGWGSMMCVFCFLGGIHLISIGVIGEYVGKIYLWKR